MQYVFGSGAAVGESPGEEEQQDGVLPPVQPAPSIVAEEADEEEEEEGGVRPRGQWSPLPLEPEEYAGQLVVPEEEDAQEILALRQKVGFFFSLSLAPRRQLIDESERFISYLSLWFLDFLSSPMRALGGGVHVSGKLELS
jgi:hypothetical protein